MTTYNPNLCRSCLRLNSDGSTCAAYPDGIPDEIRVFGEDHRMPLPGDHGLRYVFDERKAKDREDWLSVALADGLR